MTKNARSGEPPSSMSAVYFDGQHSQAHAVQLKAVNGQLMILGEAAGERPRVARRVPLSSIRWGEPTSHGQRVAHIADEAGGGSLHAVDAAQITAWDEWLAAQGIQPGWVTRAHLSWRWAAAAVLATVMLVVAGYLWGLPLAARGVVAWVPESVDQSVGEAALASFESDMLKPSQLPLERQASLRHAFERVVKAAHGGPGQPPAPSYQLLFRASAIGPNAFAVPGGTIVLTDELVTLVTGSEGPGRAGDEMVMGVLAHELGHVRLRHGMQALVQVTLLGALSSVVLGDFSAVLAGVPVVLGQAAYSRDAEREADEESIRMLKAAGMSPLVMVNFFERMAAVRQGQGGASSDGPGRLGIAIASHPSDAERVARFRRAAAR
jgi:Zn-dependent protease with chaperone function